MKLSFEQIKSITAGAVNVREENGAVRFFRFLDKQAELYKSIRKDFYEKSFCTAGVKLKFITNSKNLSLSILASLGSSRHFFDIDVSINGKLCYTLSGNIEKDGVIATTEASATYALGEGEKTVCVYFPWSVDCRLISLELDDGATFAPYKYSKNMLIFGDSITHGYDARNPSLAYSSLVADFLDANAVNKAIGAEVFRPELCAIQENFTPDVITVAYGTNDWGQPRERFERCSEEFYHTLARLYPNAKIISLAPIWRLGADEQREFGSFDTIRNKFHEISKSIPNMTVIDCFPFIPQDVNLFADLRLHPNNDGFKYYADGIINELKEIL